MITSSIRSQSLDGTWKIKKDPGGASNWSGINDFPEDAWSIKVPGNIWEIADYIYYNDYVWYSRLFTPEMILSPRMNYYLRFGAIQYYSDVYLNGILLGSHEGADTPFEYEATALLLQEENRLTIRVKNPKSFGADPVTFDMGGITQHVTLVAQPKVRIKDVFAKPDITGWKESKTGNITLEITLENNTSLSASPILIATLREAGANLKKLEVRASTTIEPNATSKFSLKLSITDCKLWSVDHPNLYSITVKSTLQGDLVTEADEDEYAFRTGLRDLRIASDGCFHLNNERIYIKSLHDTAFYPIIFQNTRDYSKFRDVLVALKAAGFNTWRYLNYMPLPELMDLADEVGMIVYAEHQGSWNMKDLLDPAKFVLSMHDVVKTSRNHPSLAIWGLMNETYTGGVFEAALGYLPALREIDDTRLVLLGSGRFDMQKDDEHQRQAKIGSASNPGSAQWDVYMGGEHPTNPASTGLITDTISVGFTDFTGDAHVYQYWPNTPLFYRQIAEFGQSTKPIFVSEAGVGNAYNPISELLKIQQAGGDSAGGFEPIFFLNHMADGLQKAWTKYNLFDEYPLIEDYAIDSFTQQTRQREIMFNIIRSNASIMGYSLTSKIDGGGYAEGIFDAFNEFKPGIMDVLQAGWSKLRWNLFINPGIENSYTDQPLSVKVTLANEDELPVLPSGAYYPITLVIAGKHGVVWKQEIVDFNVSGKLADLVFEGIITADQWIQPLLEGSYTLSVAMTKGGHPSSSKLKFHITDRKNHKNFSGRSLAVLGVPSEACELLKLQNAVIVPYNPKDAVDHEVIVVGDRKTLGDEWLNSAAAWRQLYQKAANGAQIVFLDPALLSDGTIVSRDGDAADFRSANLLNKWLPLEGNKGTQRYNEKTSHGDWLYHKEYIAKFSSVFDDMNGTGLMDPEYYSGVFVNAKYFSGIAVPDSTAAVAIFCNMCVVFEGVVIGTYHFHAGKFTIQSLSILDHIGTPAADRLLINMTYQAVLDSVPSSSNPITESDWDLWGIN